jgi:hypothetical protein
LATIRALPRNPSDHAPLLWENKHGDGCGRNRFRIEKWWMQQEEFKELVKKVWATRVDGEKAIDRWQNKIRLLRKKVRGWSTNAEAEIKRRKKILSEEYEKLDVMAETRDLSNQERDRVKEVSGELNRIWEVEETKARQRARERHMLEGDKNTKYFHAVANQRRRKTTVHTIEGPDGAVDSTKEIIEVATQYYKNLFRFEPRPDIKLSEGFFTDEERLTEGEKDMLEKRFSEEEIKKAVFESYSDGAPGPDGISFMFYQQFWDIIKMDLMEMFEDFFEGRLDLYRLNFALITIIPKEKDSRTMNKFRPISLLNCSYKIFTRVLTSRVGLVADRLIASNQTAFIKGRYILESVVTAHETLHSVHQSKQEGFVMKLDYEKEYDKVSWEFMLEVLEKRGFGGKWLEWIRHVLH